MLLSSVLWIHSCSLHSATGDPQQWWHSPQTTRKCCVMDSGTLPLSPKWPRWLPSLLTATHPHLIAPLAQASFRWTPWLLCTQQEFPVSFESLGSQKPQKQLWSFSVLLHTIPLMQTLSSWSPQWPMIHSGDVYVWYRSVMTTGISQRFPSARLHSSVTWFSLPAFCED